MKTVYKKTKKPTGLTLKRDGSRLTAGWKCGDTDYDKGQGFAWIATQPGTRHDVSITTKARSYSWTINPKSYYPYTKRKLRWIRIFVGGQRKTYEKSGVRYYMQWSGTVQKTFSYAAPTAPSCSNAASDYTNARTYKWDYTVSATSNRWFSDVEWQTILVKNSNITNGAKLKWNSKQTGWKTGTGGKSGSRTITEDSASLATASWTRWFRARCRGPAGVSAWAYTKHVYATPYAAKITSVKTTPISAGYRVHVVWTADQKASHPIDETQVQYLIAVPTAGIGCPKVDNWTDVATVRDTGGKDGYTFDVPQGLERDHALFVRVNTTWDSNINYSAPKLALMSKLANPSELSATVDPTTRKATIKCTNEADEIPDSFIAIYYCTKKNPGGYVCAIIPHGQESVTNIQLPAATGTDSFKAKAVVGSYKATSRADGATAYTTTEKATSNTISYGGSIPTAPTGVTAQETDILGTVRVTWNWSWTAATAAEVSWSDHADAWESTDEPSTHVVNSIEQNRLNISGLETGVTWYIRVRLKQESGDTETYGPYSETVTIDLSSAPAIPVLTLSAPVITQDG